METVRRNKLYSTEPTVFDLAIVVRDGYHTSYNAITAEREKEMKYLRDNYKEGSTALQNEKDRINATYTAKLTEARNSVKDAMRERIQRIRGQMESRVTQSNNDLLTKFKFLDEIPVSGDELSLIACKYGGTQYFFDRFLRSVAEKNGIDLSNGERFPLMQDYSKQSEAINELEAEMETMLSRYDGNNDFTGFAALSDRKVYSLERKYEGTERNSYTNRQLINRCASLILSQTDEMKKGFALRNALKNASEAVRDGILAQLSGKLSSTAKAYSTYADAIEAFENGEADKYSQAEILADKVRSLRTTVGDKQPELLTAMLNQGAENKYFVNMISPDIAGSDTLRQAAECVNAERKETVYDVFDSES